MISPNIAAYRACDKWHDPQELEGLEVPQNLNITINEGGIDFTSLTALFR